jgi:hypothetical protein
MANLKRDERTLLSKESVEAKLLRDHKIAALGTIPMLLMLIGMAILLTAISSITGGSDRYWGYLAVLLVWCAVLAFLYAVTLRPLTLRRQIAKGLLALEEDEVNGAVEETKRTARGNYRQVFVLYLHKYGRVEISQSLWSMLVDGDRVYVAVLHTKKPRVMEVYSTLTHKLTLPQGDEI